MKSTIRKSTYKAIYRLLDRVSPVPFDCGELCGCACCLPEGDDLGIYLLPGEEKIFTGCEEWLTWNYDDAEDYEFPDSWHGKVPFICCNTPPVCDRSMRPIQCRTYPVAPHLMTGDDSSEEKLILILSDIDAPYICPLIEKNSVYVSECDDKVDNNGDDNGDDHGDDHDDLELLNIKTVSENGKHSSDLKLDERFLKATHTIWKHLIKDPLIRDLVILDSDEREFFVPVYPKF